MRESSSRAVAFTPIAAWLALITKTSEMLVASAEVIGHRTGRMLLSGPLPGPSDQREFELMSSEKIAAAMDSSQAMASHMVSLNMRLWRQMFTAQMGAATAMASLATSRTPTQAFERQVHLVRAINRTTVSAERLSHSAARLVHRGLAPIHSRAVANAKRLGQR